jgi:hypothetical protein
MIKMKDNLQKILALSVSAVADWIQAEYGHFIQRRESSAIPSAHPQERRDISVNSTLITKFCLGGVIVLAPLSFGFNSGLLAFSFALVVMS